VEAEPSVIHPVARLGMGRAHTPAGDIAAARRAYEDAFTFWKQADTDIRILVQARTEYAALKAQ
jgi:hypothetical protein